MHYTINNNTSSDLSQLKDLTNKFLPFAQKRIGFNRPPVINFNSDEENAKNPLGSTAHYDPNNMVIVIYIDGRHIKDILRSLAHELVHHCQNCNGKFNRKFSTEPGYAQSDKFLRGMEEEAYKLGNLCFRDWEDEIKQQLPLYETIYRETLLGGEPMSIKSWKDQELNNLLMEKWGLKPPAQKKPLDEELDAYMDTSKGGDYKTGDKVLEEEDDDDDSDDDDEEDSSDTHPSGVENRLKVEVKKAILKKKINLSDHPKKNNLHEQVRPKGSMWRAAWNIFSPATVEKLKKRLNQYFVEIVRQSGRAKRAEATLRKAKARRAGQIKDPKFGQKGHAKAAAENEKIITNAQKELADAQAKKNLAWQEMRSVGDKLGAKGPKPIMRPTSGVAHGPKIPKAAQQKIEKKVEEKVTQVLDDVEKKYTDQAKREIEEEVEKIFAEKFGRSAETAFAPEKFEILKNTIKARKKAVVAARAKVKSAKTEKGKTDARAVLDRQKKLLKDAKKEKRDAKDAEALRTLRSDITDKNRKNKIREKVEYEKVKEGRRKFFNRNFLGKGSPFFPHVPGGKKGGNVARFIVRSIIYVHIAKFVMAMAHMARLALSTEEGRKEVEETLKEAAEDLTSAGTLEFLEITPQSDIVRQKETKERAEKEMHIRCRQGIASIYGSKQAEKFSNDQIDQMVADDICPKTKEAVERIRKKERLAKEKETKDGRIAKPKKERLPAEEF